MSFTAPFTATTGAVYTAAQFNTYTRDNLNALWVGSAAGDIDYYSSAVAKTRIAKGTAYQALRMNAGATAPEWQTALSLHAKAIASYDPAGQEVTSTSYTDVTNGTTTITIAKTSTIVMINAGSMGCDSSKNIYARCNIGGNVPASDSASAMLYGDGFGIYPYTTVFYKTGVGAGTITCKCQVKLSSAGGKIYPGYGTILLLAFEE